MRDRIQAMCADLERAEDVRILFAVENGSRAWRMASRDSDHDVRFVFARPAEDYLRIKSPPDVLNASFDAQGHPCGPQDAVLDATGFDVIKFARLLAASNPTCIEWLVSDIVYWGEQDPVFSDWAISHYDPMALYHHYRALCRNNYEGLIESGKKVTDKTYLYALRGMVNATWVVRRGGIPPIAFAEALAAIDGLLPASARAEMEAMLRRKANGSEQDPVDRQPELDRVLGAFLAKEAEPPDPSKARDVEQLDARVAELLL